MLFFHRLFPFMILCSLAIALPRRHPIPADPFARVCLSIFSPPWFFFLADAHGLTWAAILLLVEFAPITPLSLFLGIFPTKHRLTAPLCNSLDPTFPSWQSISPAAILLYTPATQEFASTLLRATSDT